MSAIAEYPAAPMDSVISIPSDSELLEIIESFIARHNMAPTAFGRKATGEASFIATMKDGRKVSLHTANRIVNFMAKHDAQLAAQQDAASPDKHSGNIGTVVHPDVPVPPADTSTLSAPGRLPAAGVCETSPAAGQEAAL